MSLELHALELTSLAMPKAGDIDDPKTERQAGRMVKAGLGWTMVVVGPPIGLATPMIPIGFVIFGAGATLVIRNSESGRRFIQSRSRWAERKWPKAYGKMPAKLRRELSGR